MFLRLHGIRPPQSRPGRLHGAGRPGQKRDADLGKRMFYRRRSPMESKHPAMIDITHKFNTLRQAVALATVKISDTRTLEAIRENKVPKGDIFEFSRAAGLLAIKKTSDIIPDCH